MHIAVNARFLIAGSLEGFGHYTHELMSRIAQLHPDDNIDLYFDRRFSSDFLYSQQVKGHLVRPPARHPVLFYLWYQHTLRRALKKASLDVFFSPDGFMPLGLSSPSVITVHDVAHQPYPGAISGAQKKYYAHFIPKFLKQAHTVITVSEFSKREITKYYSLDAAKIKVIYNGIGNEYVSLDMESQEKVRAQYARGWPYFLFVGAIHPRKNVARLIAAYTEFRRITKQHIKLLIVGRKSWDYADVDRAVTKSAYREDIIFTGYTPIQTLARITASAEALCYVSLYEGFGLPVAESMACGVPVIVSGDSAHAEIAGPAGLNVDPLDPESIASGMQRVVDDKNLREALVQAGLERRHMFSWDKAASETYSLLYDAAQGNAH